MPYSGTSVGGWLVSLGFSCAIEKQTGKKKWPLLRMWRGVHHPEGATNLQAVLGPLTGSSTWGRRWWCIKNWLEFSSCTQERKEEVVTRAEGEEEAVVGRWVWLLLWPSTMLRSLPWCPVIYTRAETFHPWGQDQSSAGWKLILPLTVALNSVRPGMRFFFDLASCVRRGHFQRFPAGLLHSWEFLTHKQRTSCKYASQLSSTIINTSDKPTYF